METKEVILREKSPESSPIYSSAEDESEDESFSCGTSDMNDFFLEQLQSTLAHFEIIAEDGIKNTSYLKYFVTILRSKIGLLKECHTDVKLSGLENRIHDDDQLNTELIEAGNERLNELVSSLGSRLACQDIVQQLDMYDMVLEKLEEDYIVREAPQDAKKQLDVMRESSKEDQEEIVSSSEQDSNCTEDSELLSRDSEVDETNHPIPEDPVKESIPSSLDNVPDQADKNVSHADTVKTVTFADTPRDEKVDDEKIELPKRVPSIIIVDEKPIGMKKANIEKKNSAAPSSGTTGEDLEVRTQQTVVNPCSPTNIDKECGLGDNQVDSSREEKEIFRDALNDEPELQKEKLEVKGDQLSKDSLSLEPVMNVLLAPKNETPAEGLSPVKPV